MQVAVGAEPVLAPRLVWHRSWGQASHSEVPAVSEGPQQIAGEEE